MEFFRYMKDLLDENDCGHIKIFGGGGGTILPNEIRELQRYGITRIYSPDDGRKMGLEGMIEDVIKQCSPTQTLPNREGFANTQTLKRFERPAASALPVKSVAWPISAGDANWG